MCNQREPYRSIEWSKLPREDQGVEDGCAIKGMMVAIALSTPIWVIGIIIYLAVRSH